MMDWLPEDDIAYFLIETVEAWIYRPSIILRRGTPGNGRVLILESWRRFFFRPTARESG